MVERFEDLRVGHRRRMATILGLLDQAVCEFEQWGEARQIVSVLYQETNSLSASQRERIREQVLAVRVSLRHLKDEFELDGLARDAVTAIRSNCVSLCVNLAELEAKRLKRYGAITPETGIHLASAVAELTDRIKAIGQIVDHEPM